MRRQHRLAVVPLGWRRPLSGLVGSLCVLILNADGLRAQPVADTVRLSLAAAREAALRSNPDLRAAGLDTAIARGAFRQAGLVRFNPSADLLLGVGANVAEPSLSQEIELFGQRGARRAVGRARVDLTRADVVNVRRLTLGAVDRTFYRLVAATRRTELADDVFALNQRLADVAERQLAAGEISRLDYNLAVVELGRSRAFAIAVRRERTQEDIELRRLLGVNANVPLQPVIDSTQHPAPADSARIIAPDVIAVLRMAGALDVDSLTALALRQRPDLAAATSAVRLATADVAVSRREGLPNLVARVASEARNSGSGRVVRPGVGITLPLFNRNQGETEGKRAAVTQVTLQRDALTTRVRAEIAAAVMSYRSAAVQVEVLETTVLAPARQNRQLLETAYREGKVGLPVLLLIRNQVIGAELDYWSAWLAEREAIAVLAEATGANIASDRLPTETPR